MKAKTKNGKIEFLRFYFAIIILLFHIAKRFLGTNGGHFAPGLYFFAHGCIGVEFFFLVSGYLLAAKLYKMRDEESPGLGGETAHFMWGKIWKVFPYHLFATTITIILNALFLHHSASERVGYLIDSWASVFLLQVFGFESTWANKLNWYLAVWLMVNFIFYPIGRKNYDVFVKIVCPIIALFLLGYLDYTTQSLSCIDVWTGHFYKCFLRGAAEMALGCVGFSFTNYLNRIKFTDFAKKFFLVVEIAGYVFMLLYANTKMTGRYEFPVLFLMFGLMIISFSKLNPGNKYFGKPIFNYLGSLSLLIYLNQFWAIRLVVTFYKHGNFAIQCLLCIAITFAGSLICERVVYRWKNRTKRVKKLFIEE